MSQLGFDFESDARAPSREGNVYFCFKPPPLVVEKATPLVNSSKAEGLITKIQPPDTWHVSLAPVGPYQEVEEIAAKACLVADGLRGEQFTLELSQLLPFGGPTAVLAPLTTPEPAIALQRALALGMKRPRFKPKVGLNAHMTIAWTNAPIHSRRLDEVIVWHVIEYFLVLSRPKRGHEILGRWSLT